MAESHRSSSPDSLFVPQEDHYDNSHSSHRRRLTPGLALPSRPTHYPGDGFDFRRPVMLSDTRQNTPGQNAAVVDLTSDEDNLDLQDTGTEPTSVPAVEAPAASRASRGPRFGREIIIDLESEDEDLPQDIQSPARAVPSSNIESLFAPRFNQRGPPTHHHHHHTHNHNHHHHHHRHRSQHPQFSVLRRPTRPTPPPNMDDDLELLDSRPAPRATRAPRSFTPYPSEPIDLTGDDDVVLVRTQPRQGVNLDRPDTVAGTRTRSIADPLAAIAGLFGGNGRLVDRFHDFWATQAEPNAGNSRNTNNNNASRGNRGAGEAGHAHIHFGAVQALPGVHVTMDYGLPAFNMGLEGGNHPPQPKYEPPRPAEPGFTRSPGEDEVVVCPNCGDELAMGDDELKQQVWVIKKCGHAYCGVCTENRTKSSTARTKGKGKGKAPDRLPGTFNKCVVEGCKASTTKGAMVHVYLAS